MPRITVSPLMMRRYPYAGMLLPGLLLLLVSGAARALPTPDPVPGGVAIVPVVPVNSGNITPKAAHFNKRRVMLLKDKGTWLAVVGIPLKTRPGQQSLKVTARNGKQWPVSFSVKPKEYATQYLTIKNKRQVNPNKQDLKRIGKERAIINGAFKEWLSIYPATDFTLPVVGRFSSPFGLRRFFNKQPRKPHSGLDIAAPKGTPIKAPADARVVATGNFFFNGNSVFLDHGQGLITMYSHMDSISVTKDQQIKQGELIGTIGMTGRVTGPHLHWTVSLNNTRVDPALFISRELQGQSRTTVPKKP
ncbi:MAG: M23 family metallopeptidase [Gammaproteobacteria bacterium]|nr:MAG: M23 family metallopeptidase [Gammaproteobacteria bacterium]